MLLVGWRKYFALLLFALLQSYIVQAFRQHSVHTAILRSRPNVNSYYKASSISKLPSSALCDLKGNFNDIRLQLAKKPAVAATIAAVARMIRLFSGPTSAGGFLAGGLHAITGPDHLAAILPASVGKSGIYGAKMGALWGLGHGLSATALGASAFFLKGRLSKQFTVVEKISNLANSAVGASLLLIGLIGIKESMDEGAAEAEEELEGTKKGSYGAIVANGVLHGFSWDGVPSIAPAIAMSSWQNAAIYLACYSIGTMVTMSASAGTISSLSTGLGKIANSPELPKKLSFFSSLFAVLIGIYWIVQALLGR